MTNIGFAVLVGVDVKVFAGVMTAFEFAMQGSLEGLGLGLGLGFRTAFEVRTIEGVSLLSRL